MAEATDLGAGLSSWTLLQTERGAGDPPAHAAPASLVESTLKEPSLRIPSTADVSMDVAARHQATCEGTVTEDECADSEEEWVEVTQSVLAVSTYGEDAHGVLSMGQWTSPALADTTVGSAAFPPASVGGGTRTPSSAEVLPEQVGGAELARPHEFLATTAESDAGPELADGHSPSWTHSEEPIERSLPASSRERLSTPRDSRGDLEEEDIPEALIITRSMVSERSLLLRRCDCLGGPYGYHRADCNCLRLA